MLDDEDTVEDVVKIISILIITLIVLGVAIILLLEPVTGIKLVR